MFIATVDWPSEELSFNCLAMHEAGGAGVQVATDMCSVICRDPNIRTVHNFMNEYLYTSMHTYHKYIHIYLHKYIHTYTLFINLDVYVLSLNSILNALKVQKTN